VPLLFLENCHER